MALTFDPESQSQVGSECRTLVKRDGLGRVKDILKIKLLDIFSSCFVCYCIAGVLGTY